MPNREAGHLFLAAHEGPCGRTGQTFAVRRRSRSQPLAMNLPFATAAGPELGKPRLVMTTATNGSYSPSEPAMLRERPGPVNRHYNGNMNENTAQTALPQIHLKNSWTSRHPWIFQKLVEKPVQRPKPGSLVDIIGNDGLWTARGFYNGHSRISLRLLERDPDIAVDAAWFSRKIAEAVSLRRDQDSSVCAGASRRFCPEHHLLA